MGIPLPSMAVVDAGIHIVRCFSASGRGWELVLLGQELEEAFGKGTGKWVRVESDKKGSKV